MTLNTNPGKTADRLRIGIDLGGTKIAARALLPDGAFSAEQRLATPREDYEATLAAIADLTKSILAKCGGQSGSTDCVFLGVGTPGSTAPSSGRIQNANSTWLNGRTLGADLQARLQLPVRLANDANCLALSEASDGAATGAKIVFGVILGTGCGGGIVANGTLLDGPRGIGGEWGHNPLPNPAPDEVPGPDCWCGRKGCIETWISGPALEADYARRVVSSGSSPPALSAAQIERAAASGDPIAAAALAAHLDRSARALAGVVNILDPDVIVLGGGLSNMAHLYTDLPAAIAPHIFADDTRIEVRPPKWGDASGVRGAARLW